MLVRGEVLVVFGVTGTLFLTLNIRYIKKNVQGITKFLVKLEYIVKILNKNPISTGKRVTAFGKKLSSV